MRWGLDVLLGLIGILMGFMSVMGWIVGWEGAIVGLLVGVVVALILGQFAGGKYFWNGFVVGGISALLSSLVMLLQFDTYFAHFAETAKFKDTMDKMTQAGKSVDDLKSIMHTTTLIGVPFGIAIGGAIQGLFAWLAGKVFGKKPAPLVVSEPVETPTDNPENPSA
jgi:hypothetical protein